MYKKHIDDFNFHIRGRIMNRVTHIEKEGRFHMERSVILRIFEA